MGSIIGIGSAEGDNLHVSNWDGLWILGSVVSLISGPALAMGILPEGMTLASRAGFVATGAGVPGVLWAFLRR